LIVTACFPYCRFACSRYVLRLYHTVEAALGGVPVTVDLASLFPHATITNLQPMTLTLQWPSTYQRQQWPSVAPSSLAPIELPVVGAGMQGDVRTLMDAASGSSVTLNPMDIVTYVFGLFTTGHGCVRGKCSPCVLMLATLRSRLSWHYSLAVSLGHRGGVILVRNGERCGPCGAAIGWVPPQGGQRNDHALSGKRR
jgi:hypothetical protein